MVLGNIACCASGSSKRALASTMLAMVILALSLWTVIGVGVGVALAAESDVSAWGAQAVFSEEDFSYEPVDVDVVNLRGAEGSSVFLDVTEDRKSVV